MIALVLAACDEAAPFQPDAADPTVDAAVLPAGPMAVVVSGVVGEGGIMSRLDVNSLKVTENTAPAGGVGDDPVIRRFGDRIYVVSRYGTNAISVFDARTARFLEQYGTGAGSNPLDIAVLGDYIYAAIGAAGGLVKVKLGTGELTSIDVSSAVGDPDGNPDCVSVYAVDTRVYVACGVYDEFYTPRSNGKLAIVDTADGDSVTSITLPSTNPQSFIIQTPASSIFGGDLLVPLTPSYSDYTTGCTARVSTGASPTASCAAGLTNMDVGGLVAHSEVSTDGKLLMMAITTIDASFMNPTGTLKVFDLEEGTLWPALSPTDQLIVDAAPCPDGSIVTLDRKKDVAGIRVYGKDTKERTSEPLSFGLTPLFGNNTLCYDPAAL
jgi:DNA-binding beta-propeller fold protein YncE